jgi:hypothetical protein
MTLQELVVSLDVGQSLTDLTAQVRSHEEVVEGLAQSGYVLSYIASIGKLGALRTIASTDGHPLQDAADATLVTLQTRDGIDFSGSAQNTMLDAFVAGGVLIQPEADAIKSIGQKTVKPFANIRECDVVEVR